MRHKREFNSTDADRILLLVAHMHGLSIKDILEGGRHASIVAARRLAMYAIWKFTGATTLAVGEYFNKRHATVIHHLKTMESFLSDETDDIRASVEREFARGSLNLIRANLEKPAIEQDDDEEVPF